VTLAVFEPGSDAVTALYLLAVVLFILGVRQGTHPTTAKRGNMVAAVGMAIAVATTLLLDGIGNWGLIAVGIGIGTAVGVIASIRVQMTAMPQMVALYNGVVLSVAVPPIIFLWPVIETRIPLIIAGIEILTALR
jgi:NAD/NADP transhydrogenase beta subunit